MKKIKALLGAFAVAYGAFCVPALANGPSIDGGALIVGCKYNAANGPAFTADGYANLQCDANGNLKTTSSGGAASNGSVTAAGTNGTVAQAIQGITGGIPVTVTGGGSNTSPDIISAGQFARTYRGGTITTGGTAQNWAGAGVITHGCQFQNTSSSPEYLRSDGNAASATSLYVAPNGGFYACTDTGVPTAAFSVYGATTGQTFYAETW